MTKVTKPLAGVKHIKTNPYYIIRTKEDLNNSRCKAYEIIIK